MAMVYAHATWTARNELTQVWEEQSGVAARKRHARQHRWRMTGAEARSHRKRGRPEKAWADLSPQYSRRKESRLKKQELIQQLGEGRGKAAHKEWLEARRRLGDSSVQHDQRSITDWVVEMEPGELSQWQDALRGDTADTGSLRQTGDSWAFGPVGRCTYTPPTGRCEQVGDR